MKAYLVQLLGQYDVSSDIARFYNLSGNLQGFATIQNIIYVGQDLLHYAECLLTQLFIRALPAEISFHTA